MASFYREEILQRTLQRIKTENPPNLRKLILLMHCEDAPSLNMVKDQFENFPLEVVTVNERTSPGRSRNLLVEKSRASWICFLDDDVEVSSQYFETADQIITHEDFLLFGGPDQPLKGDQFQEIIGSVLESSFTMGTTAARHSRKTSINRNASELDLTLCNLWVERALFEKNDLKFDETLRRCEENLLLDEIQNKNNIKFGYFPQLYVYHLRRTQIIETLQIQFFSGFYRGVEMNLPGAKFKKIFLIPLATGALILLLPIFSVRTFILLVLVHTSFNIFYSIKILIEKRSLRGFFMGFGLVCVIHSAFSLGILGGWFKGKFFNG